MVKLVHEIWEGDGWSCLCLAGPDGDRSRSLNEPGGRLTRTFEAGSYFEAMTLHNQLLGYKPWKPEPGWEDEPYTEEQLARQQGATR